MNDSTNTHGTLAGAHAVILNDDSTKEKRRSLIINIILMVLCATVCTLSLIVYHKWQQIPFRKHTFQAEYVASNNLSARPRVSFYLVDYKILDINKGIDTVYLRTIKQEGRLKCNIIGSDYIEAFSIASGSLHNPSHPRQHYSLDSLNRLIGQTLLTELSNSCKTNNVDIRDYSEMFFYRHLDNEVALSKSMMKKHQITFGDNNCCIYEKNDYTLSDSLRESYMNIITNDFYQKAVNKKALSKSIYNNISQAVVLTPNNGFDSQTIVDTKITASWYRFFENLIKMEDISQTHYLITMRSYSITDLYLKMEFCGSIQCIYTPRKDVYSPITIENSDRMSLNVGGSFIELARKNDNIHDINYDVLVKFNDMQNMQAFRLFVLAALITLCFTQCIKSVFKILVMIITTDRKRRKHKPLSEYELNINDIYQEDNDDMPDYFWNKMVYIIINSDINII